MLSYYGLTDVGKRKNNEDSFSTITLKHKSSSKKLHLLVVADGLGGHAAGEVASKLAIVELTETVKKGLNSIKKEIDQQFIKKLLLVGFRKANEEICHQAKIMPWRKKMGTTLVAAILRDDGTGVVANLGDSRAYLINSVIDRITKDHSYVQELVDRGLVTEEEAFDHPEKNIVTKVIGIENGDPDLYEVDLSKGILLLCSDGLTDALRDEEVKELVKDTLKTGGMKEVCRELVDSAKVEGRDNITVITAKL